MNARHLMAGLMLASAVLAAGCGGETDNTVKVYLLAGQSNAIGQSPLYELSDPTLYTQPMENVFLYDGCPNAEELGAAGKLVPLKAGYGVTEACFGPEVGMGEVLRPEKGRIVIVKVAEGNTSLDEMWRSPSAGTAGYLYEALIKTVKEALSAIEEEGNVPEIAGMAWMQGERDALVESTANNYGQLLKAFISDVRTALGSTFPFAIGEINRDDYLMPCVDTVLSQMRQVAAETEGVTTIDTSELKMRAGDEFHYRSESMLLLGKKFGEALKNQ